MLLEKRLRPSRHRDVRRRTMRRPEYFGGQPGPAGARQAVAGSFRQPRSYNRWRTSFFVIFP